MPAFDVDVDRTRAQYAGLTERDVTNSLVVNLAGSSQVAPTFWLNPQNGVSYPIVMQTPQYRLDDSVGAANLPITRGRQRRAAAARRHRATSGAASATRWSRNTTSSRWCRSTRRRRTAISAPSPPTSARSIDAHAQRTAEGLVACAARPGAHDEERVLGPAVRPARRDRADLSADRRELPVVERSVRDHHRAAGRARRHRLDAVRDVHDAVGAGADRRDHVHGRRDREQRARDQLRARAARRDSATRSPPRSKPASCASARC